VLDRHARAQEQRVADIGGEDEIFAELYPSLRRLAAIVRPSEVDPDDLVQDALARALAARPLRDFDDVGAYLRTVIVNLAKNHRRSFARRPRMVASMGDETSSGGDVYPSDLDDLRRLEVDERAVLYLSVVEGRSFAEIGTVLECSEEAARTRASRARKRLRAELREEATHDPAQ
jgi:RNA polymerase sigma-70 factor (ECF subfamily)